MSGLSSIVGAAAVLAVACADRPLAGRPSADAGGTAETGAIGRTDATADSEAPPPLVDLGRWTSSMFEDPFEARFSIKADGQLSGYVCGPSLLEGGNCGALSAAWVSGALVHFDYELPWTGLIPGGIGYQFVGGIAGDFASSQVINGVVMTSNNPGASYPLQWTRCPAPERWCPAQP